MVRVTAGWDTSITDAGSRFAKVSLGMQEVEMDLDMLLSDFYVVTTTSTAGSRYDDFFSESYGMNCLTGSESSQQARMLTLLLTVNSNAHPYPSCTLPTELIHLPKSHGSVPISFAHCRPSKSSLATLAASGMMLGLAPSHHLSQTGTPTLLAQFLATKTIARSIFSIMLINGQEGVLSVGGTGAEAVDYVEAQTRKQLDEIGALQRTAVTDQPPSTDINTIVKRESEPGTTARDPNPPDWRTGWKWSNVQGAEGWWQTLLQGVWVDGSKVLQNQPVVIDVRFPLIPLSPPHPSILSSLQPR